MVFKQHVKFKTPISRRNSFISIFFLYAIYVLAIIHTYVFQIADENAYAGMQPWVMTAAGWVCLGIILPLMAFIASRVKGNPSDFFVIFYSAIPVVSFCTLTSTSGKISNSILLPSLAVIISPLVPIFILQYLVPKIKWRGIVSSTIIERVLLGILFLVIMYSYVNSPESTGFDIISSYNRRLEGREIYADGSLIAYALGMCMNGFTPYLAFRGAVSGRSSLVLVALGSVIFFYWLLGVKAPFVYVLLSYFVGSLSRREELRHLVKYFLVGIIGLYFLVLIEWWFFDNHSIIADFGFRRLFSVQTQIQGYYLDFLMVDTPSFWNLLLGVSDQSFKATYYIGKNYMDNPDGNANTNAFLYGFAANGLFGYLVAIFFVSTFLVSLDRLYQSTHNPSYLLIGFVYGILLTEQAFSTAILSSGVGLLFLITFFEKYNVSAAETFVKI
jgi:hypothetical protein